MRQWLFVCAFLTHSVNLSACSTLSFTPDDCQTWAALATELALELEKSEMTDDERAAKAQRYTVLGGKLADAGCKQFVPAE